jgi:tetratricopeptide (TPR) repeat protein
MGVSRAKQAPAPKAFDIQAAGMWALLFLATLTAYLPALHGGLIWDDNMHVTPPELQSLHGLWRIWFDLGATQQYYPLLFSAFWLEHRLWGDAMMGYHLTNVVLHAACACLVVLIVRRLSIPGAWLAGFIFALHPVCVEAVAWISEQKSTLSGLFCLAAALTYLHFDQSRRRSTYGIALALFILGLMCKTVIATLPATLLVIFWWQRGRIDWKRDVLPLLPWFAVAIPAGLFTAWVERTPRLIGAQGSDYALTLGQRFLMAGRVPWFYAWKVLLPVNLMFIYPRWTIDPAAWWQYLFPLGLLAVAIGLAQLARRNRGPLAGFLIFAGTLFPVLGFLNVYPFRYSFVADHFQYLASLGLIVPLAAGLTILMGRMKPAVAIALPILLLATLGLASRLQAAIYTDYETLFRETLARNPGSPLLHNNLGVKLMLIPGRIPEALTEFQAAVRLKPDTADYHDNLGLALSSMPERMPEAIAEYQTALRLDPQFPNAHVNLGLALASLPSRLPEAIAQYREALRLKPDFWEAHLDLGIAYGKLPDRQADAIAEYQSALKLKPDSVQAHFNLGNALQTNGRLDEALAEYRTGLTLDPDATDVRYELAYTLAKIPGRVPEAIEECRTLLRINPNDAAGRQLMASLVAFQRHQSP